MLIYTLVLLHVQICVILTPFYPLLAIPPKTPQNTPKTGPRPPTQAQIGYFQFMFIFCEDFDPFLGLPPKTTPRQAPKPPIFGQFLVFSQGTSDTPKIPLFLTTWPYVAFDPLFWVYFNPLTCLLYPIIGVLLLYMPCSVLPIYPTCPYLTSFWVYYLLLHPCNHVLHISCLRCTLRHVMFHVTCYVIICYVMSHVICSVPPVRHTHPNQVP